MIERRQFVRSTELLTASITPMFNHAPVFAQAIRQIDDPMLLHVGPTRAIKKIAASTYSAMAAATIYVDSGDYEGHLVVWTQDNIAVSSVGGRVRLLAKGAAAEGKDIRQSSTTENPIPISFGAEGYKWPRNEIHPENNTLVNPRPKGGMFLRVMPGADSISAINNRLVGAGARICRAWRVQ